MSADIQESFPGRGQTRIERFGWRGPVEPGVGRVVSSHGDYYRLVCNEAEGEVLARKKKSAFSRMKVAAADGVRAVKRPGEHPDAPVMPVTGDFVKFRYNDCGDSLILEVLPRRSSFERRDPTARRTSQTLAVNFDALFVMMSLNENFSVPRLERYLALAEGSGGETVVVLTKSDLAREDVAACVREIAQIADGRAEVIAISAIAGDGMDRVREYARPGRTLAFIGSSGVGKSTLLNALAGEEIAATQEIQEWSGKGRHTTTVRELLMLPSGAMVIDTPGIREIGIVGESDLDLVKGECSHRYRK